MYISETRSATSVSFSVTVWVSVRVCEHSINDDELAAVWTAYTVSVIKSQQCRILHRAEKKHWAFVASLVLKDGSFLLLSAQTQQQSYQERCSSGALFHRFLQIKTCWIWLETGHGQIFPKALPESKCIKALNKTFFNWVFVHQVLFFPFGILMEAVFWSSGLKHAERCSKQRVFAPELCFRPDWFHSAWPQNSAITLKRGTGIHNLSSTHAPCAIGGWCVWVSELKITLSRACVKSQLNMFTALSQSCYWLQSTFPAESRERYQLAVCEITSVAHEEVACVNTPPLLDLRQLTFFIAPFSIRHQRSEPVHAECVVTLASLPKLELISQAWLCVCLFRGST